MPIDPKRLKELFLAASEMPSAAERAAFLDRECGTDVELRRKLDVLLRAHDDSGGFLAQPADAPAVTADSSVGGSEGDSTGSEAVGTVIGPYKLLQKLGEGGMGTVWVAEQQRPVKRRVALKVIKPGLDSAQVLRRFEAERQALALMDHTHIAKVFDAGTTPTGRPYFVMELVHGVPITRYCDELNLPIRERLGLFVPVCQALQHAHQKGIIHRDVKPSNVLVCMQDGKPVAKVIDFGVAKAMSQRLTEGTVYTEFGAVVGTLEYMAPEQAEVSPLGVDTRADVYALGVLLYELLTGTTPLDRKRLKQAAFLEMLRIIKEEEPPRPSTRLSESKQTLAGVAAHRRTEPARLTKEVRGELDWIVMRCLEKDRTRRYDTASALARDIERHLADEPVEACPPSATYRLRKFARKNRGALSTAAAFALLLVAGAGVAAWQAVRATRAEADARLAQQAEAARAEGEKQAKQDALAAAAAEKAAKEQAQRRLAQIEKGVELFAGMLTGINPRAEEKGGEPLYVQLRHRAEQAAAELDGEGVGDPLAVARLQTVLGATLRDLGSSAAAVAMLEKARATRERELGADHPDTLVTLNNLAGAYQDAGRLPEAIRLFEQARDARVAKLGADHPDTLTTLNNLALAYGHAGRLAEAIRLFEQVRDAEVAKLGADHPDTLTTVHNLAVAYEYAGKLPEAIRLYEQVRDAEVAKLGADHPHTLTTLTGLAGAYRAAGRLSEAIRMYEKVRDTQVAKLGADHPDALATLNNLAGAYGAAGRLPEAIRMYEKVRDARVVKLGADHPDTLNTLANLARAYQDAGRLPEAIRLFEQAAAGIARRKFLHEHAGRIIANTVRVYEETRQFDKAEAWQRRWLAHVKEQAGPQSPAYAGELASLGSLLLKQEKWAEAEKTVAEGQALREQQQPDAWSTFNTRSMLGGALLGQKKYADAEPLLLQGYEGMRQRQDQIPPPGKLRLPEALERLVRLYEATGREDEAAKWRKELYADAERLPPPREEKP
jgi:serine/threonine protein kinase/tetratricopeptide (TPR) repeat protein